jgi:CTP synthase
MMLHRNGYDSIVLEHFGLPMTPLNVSRWEKFNSSVASPSKKVKIAVIGKYISLQDAYRSIYEALLHGAAANDAALEIVQIDSEEIEKNLEHGGVLSMLDGATGILVPGGFGNRGIEGKIAAITCARTEGIPFFGICLGMQCALIEYGRSVCGLAGANSKEFDQDTGYPVVSLLEDQELVMEKGGTMRLGAYLCEFAAGTRIKEIYGAPSVMERHRHRFEFTIKFKDVYEKNGMVFGGFHPYNNLVETIELPGHPWFFATQYHPEFKSKPVNPHPLFKDFIRASIEKSSVV